MKKEKNRFSRFPIFFLLAIIAFMGCSKESDGEAGSDDPIPSSGNIVSGNPELNDFLITSSHENVFTVDTETGQEQLIYAFKDLTDLEILADYDNGKIYVTTDDNSVNALDVAGKSFVWDTPMLEYHFSSNGLSATVCFDGVCYASGGYGVVVALDENTGNLKWYYSTDPDGDLDDLLNEAGTPIVHGDKVFIFSKEGFISDLPAYVHVLNKQTGELLDKRELPHNVSGTPIFIGNTLIVPAKNLYALNADTFETQWVFEANGIGTPNISRDRLVVQGIPLGQSIHSAMYCLDINTGNIIWELDTGFDTIWSPVIVENVVFGVYEEASSFPFANGRPFAVALSDGKQLWFRDKVSIDSSPVYANGRLFFLGYDIDDSDNITGLLSMDANTGKILWANTTFKNGSSLTPLIIAQNGIFGPSYYRGG